MLQYSKLVALCIVATSFTVQVPAQNTPAPPDWQDSQGPSVYLTASPAGHEPTNAAPASASTTEPLQLAPTMVDSTVEPAAHQTHVEVKHAPSNKLPPPSDRGDASTNAAGQTNLSSGRRFSFGIPAQSIYTVVTALAIVVGSFLLFAWALRRGGKISGRKAGMLPTDVVSVLGRAPLAARQFAELLRVGNKLVLVALTPAGPTTLTEVTDPAEVDRLVGLCQQFEPHSTTQAFEQVIQQLTSEPVASGFLGGEAMPASFSAAAAYRSHRGAGRA